MSKIERVGGLESLHTVGVRTVCLRSATTYCPQDLTFVFEIIQVRFLSYCSHRLVNCTFLNHTCSFVHLHITTTYHLSAFILHRYSLFPTSLFFITLESTNMTFFLSGMTYFTIFFYNLTQLSAF